MENTRRGLELTRTKWVSDVGRFYRVMKDAARDAATALQHEIASEHPRNLKTHTNQIDAISEMWIWARTVLCDYENTPAVLIAVPKYALHIDEWEEDDGPVLWWRAPIEEPPYVGTPDDTDFDETYKWWTPIDIPDMPEKNELKEQ